MSIIIEPSMNCANFDCLRDEVEALDQAGCNMFHVDIMDGVYLPQMALGFKDFECIRRNTRKPVDVHLYVERPLPLVDIYAEAGADVIYIQSDSPTVVATALTRIRQLGKTPGLGINYGVSIEGLYDYLYMVDYVMLVTAPHVVPRSFAPQSWEKVQKLNAIREQTPFKLLLDGGIGPDIIAHGNTLDVDGYVLGSVALFNGRNYAGTIQQLRAL